MLTRGLGTRATCHRLKAGATNLAHANVAPAFSR